MENARNRARYMGVQFLFAIPGGKQSAKEVPSLTQFPSKLKDDGRRDYG